MQRAASAGHDRTGSCPCPCPCHASGRGHDSLLQCSRTLARARYLRSLLTQGARGIGTGTYGFCPDARACAHGSRRRALRRRGSQSPCSSSSTRAANVRSEAHARGALPAAQHRVRRCGRALELQRHSAAKSTSPHPTPVPRLAGMGAAARTPSPRTPRSSAGARERGGT